MTTNQSWKIIEGYFLNYDTSSVQKESFNYFVNETIRKIVSESSFMAPITTETSLFVQFGNVYIDKPNILPQDARNSDMSYEATVYVDIYTKLYHNLTKDLIKTESFPFTNLFRFPVMVHSNLCNLYNSRVKNTESEYDFGGYFIVKGKERVIVAQETITMNRIHVYGDKKTRSDYVAEVRSIKEGANYSVLISARVVSDTIFIALGNNKKYLSSDIPLGILVSAMGLEPMEIVEWFKPFPYTHELIKSSVKKYTKMNQEQAIEYISKYTTIKIPESKQSKYIKQIIENEIFPHIGSYTTATERVHYLCVMVLRLLQTMEGLRDIDDRDHVNNKRIESTGPLIGNLVDSLFTRFIRFATQQIEKKHESNIVAIIQKFNITNRLYYCFSTGNWGIQKSNYIRKGVTQILSRLSYSGTVSHLRRIVVPIEKNSKNTDVRHLHASSYGFTCSVETPEGATCGIVKALTMIVHISNPISSVSVIDTIKGSSVKLDEPALGECGVFVNGICIGSVQKITETVKELKRMRSCRYLNKYISIMYDRVDNEIHLNSDGGRMMRPVIKVKRLDEVKLLVQSLNPKELWTKLVRDDIVAWVDGYELDFVHVAMTPAEIVPETEYLEIHPSLMMGSCANLVPFPEHSQAPRNIYSSAMMKQSIGCYTQNYQTRFDTFSHVLHYPQKRIVSTRYADICHMDENPAGINLVVAIACYTGFNMEDSVILNKSAVDRGLFHCTSYKSTSTSETKRGTHGCERIEIPRENLRRSDMDYSCLDEFGIVRVGSNVTVDHVLVGRVYYLNEEPTEDVSLLCEESEAGIVDKVMITTNAQGYKHIKIRTRSTRIPEVGDKLASLGAQKGTIGMVYRQEDMPWGHSSQIPPDLILNPHALPSRMTINMLIEMLCGKECSISGNYQDATAFCHKDELVHEMGSKLEQHGYDRHGDEMFYNGMTGEPFKMKLFMGVCYYQRLKHMVVDKIHVRGKGGSVQSMTHQPTEGRAKQGGLRFGEMERDCIISHGSSIYLKERMHDMSDPYQITVCDSCGSILNNPEKCPMCDSVKNRRVSMPYSSKLLMQDLTAMGIKVCYK